MYNLGDDTWREQPPLMSKATIDKLVARVAEHCQQQQSNSFTYCFHGGEPLLMPPERMTYFVETARQAMPAGVEALFILQTNGVLLSRKWCHLLGDLGVRIGISIDGPKIVNDRFRVDHRGRGSYDDVIAGIEEIKAAGMGFGILSVVDVDTSATDCFAHLKSLGPRSVDLLLPEATHDRPPEHQGRTTATPYADWLLEFFECWAKEDEPPFRVRRFDTIIGTVLGTLPPLSLAGANSNEILVIETDGSIEPMDVLKVCSPGITKTDMNVHTHSLTQAIHNPLIRQYYDSFENPCKTCVECPVFPMCGGGYFPHRYKGESGFDNPSVYCPDLKALIRDVQHWTISQLPADLVERQNLVPVD